MEMRTRIGWMILTLALLAGGETRAGDWYVTTNGVDDPSGGSNSNPWASIKYAVAQTKVVNGDIVNVAAGVYTEDSITINKGVTIEGAGREGTIVQAAATPYTAADKRIFYKNTSDAAAIRNMTIRHGNFTSVNSLGSAINLYSGTLTVDNCLIVSNHSYATQSYNGGTIGMQGDRSQSLRLINSELRANTSSSNSAGVMTYNSPGPLVVSNCLFAGNVSAAGAAVDYSGDGRISGGWEIYDSTFVNNFNTSGAGAGGLQVGVNSAKVARCTFAYNSATNGTGGGMALAPDARGAAWSELQNLTFYGNSASNGGGIYMNHNAQTHGLYNCTIYSNKAMTAGGGIHGWYGTRALRSTIVAGNTAPTGPDCNSGAGSFTDNYSLVGNNSGSGLTAGSPNANGSYIGTAATNINPRLKLLANLGGATPVCGLYSDSVAIDHGYNPLGLATDQRGAGYPRVVGTTNDIGAGQPVDPLSVMAGGRDQPPARRQCHSRRHEPELYPPAG